MITLITLFFPTFLSLNILKRWKNKETKELLFLYPIYNLFINLFVLICICFHHKGEILSFNETFKILNFNIKYIILAIIFAIIIPYLFEYLSKNCHVIIEIRREKNEKKNK